MNTYSLGALFWRWAGHQPTCSERLAGMRSPPRWRRSQMNGYVLTTGAAGGLGKAFAAECASRGWDLFLTDLPEAALEPLAAGMQRMYGVQVHYHSCDLTDPDSRDALWEHIGQQGLRFHTLLNVAGTEFEGPFAGRTPSELRTILRLNDEATVEMTWRVLPHRVP